MPAKSKTRPSTPKLSEAARHVVIPEGIVTTGFPRVKAKAAELGLGFDPWQEGAHTVTLGKREDGKYAATVGGVVWSIARQVGKTYGIALLLVIMCILFPGYKVIWTAHHARTSTSAFRTMQGICRRKKIAPHILSIRQANGEQEISFRNGSIIMFGARAQGFGRGFDAVDAMVFDEAQILPEKALEDMVAATNQARHVHGALIFYLGTPPRPGDPSEAFTKKRAKALQEPAPGEQVHATRGDAIYIEMSADRDGDPDDRKQWLKANASYPTRTPEESMLRLRDNLATDEAWWREGLGVWDEDDPDSAVIDLRRWAALKGVARKPRTAVITLDVAPNRKSASIGVAAAGPSGRILVMVETHPGTAWVVPRLVKILAKREVLEVSLHHVSQASVLISDLVAESVEFVPLSTRAMGQACADFITWVNEKKRIAHVGQIELDAAVANAKTRFSSEAELWDRRDRNIDISPLVAASGAAHRWALLEDYDVMDSIG